MDGVTDGRGRAGAGEADGRADDMLRARARDSGSESSLSGSDDRSFFEPRRRFLAGVDAGPPPGAGELDGGLAGALGLAGGLGRALTLGGGGLNWSPSLSSPSPSSCESLEWWIGATGFLTVRGRGARWAFFAGGGPSSPISASSSAGTLD